MRLAIVDAGTNTLILLIAELTANAPHYRILHDECQIVRLGEGIHSNNRFLPGAMQRAIDTLSHYQKLADHFHCTKKIMLGTAACRNAKNVSEFRSLLSLNNINFDFKVIDGDEEARLIYEGSIADFVHIPKPRLIMDIGGGSTEFILETAKQLSRLSLPFGVVKLTEAFLQNDPPTAAEIEKLATFIKAELKPLYSHFSSNGFDLRTSSHQIELIATAGTPTTLSALEQNLATYQSEKVHGSTLSLQSITSQMLRLETLDLEQRSKIPCLPQKRADVIIAGVRILHTVLTEFNITKIHVSDQGLRFGVLRDQIQSSTLPK